jgi:hypothetical protein
MWKLHKLKVNNLGYKLANKEKRIPKILLKAKAERTKGEDGR